LSGIVDDLSLTTTTKRCHYELEHYVCEASSYAPEGTRERWNQDGSQIAPDPFDDWGIT